MTKSVEPQPGGSKLKLLLQSSPSTITELTKGEKKTCIPQPPVPQPPIPQDIEVVEMMEISPPSSTEKDDGLPMKVNDDVSGRHLACLKKKNKIDDKNQHDLMSLHQVNKLRW